jgi:hypothetical protein
VGGGYLFATPIISQPQTAILSTGSISDRAVVGTAGCCAPIMTHSLTTDHRAIDGAPQRFIDGLTALLERPQMLARQPTVRGHPAGPRAKSRRLGRLERLMRAAVMRNRPWSSMAAGSHRAGCSVLVVGHDRLRHLRSDLHAPASTPTGSSGVRRISGTPFVIPRCDVVKGHEFSARHG